MKNSAAMEKEGLERSLKYLTEEGLSVNTLITGRHVQKKRRKEERLCCSSKVEKEHRPRVRSPGKLYFRS